MLANLGFSYYQEILIYIFVVLLVLHLFLGLLFKIFPILSTVDTPLPFILPVKMLFNLLIFLIETTLFINVALSFAAAHSGVDFFVNHNIIINTIIFPISLILAMHIRSFLLRD